MGTKISEMPAASSLGSDDLFHIVQGGANKRLSASLLESSSSEVYNVKDYGAVGDGSTDDTSAIKSAISAASGGGVVYLPPGSYRTTAVILLSDNQAFVGAGRGASSLVPATTISGDDGAYGVIGAKGKSNVRFADFAVDLQANNCANNGIVLWPTVTTDDAMSGPPCMDCVIERCEVKPYNNGTSGPTGYAIWNRRAQGTRILNNLVSGDTATYDSDSEQEGIEVFGGEDVLVFGNRVENIGNVGIFINTKNDATQVHNHRIMIVENHVKGCGTGILGHLVAYSAAQGLQIGKQWTIDSNHVVDCYDTGIEVRQATATPNASDLAAHSIVVSGNLIETDNTLAGAAQNVGLVFDKQTDNGLLSGCQLIENTCRGGKSGSSRGIIYANRLNGGVVRGNVVSGDSQIPGESNYLLYINNSSQFSVIDNTLHEANRGCLALNNADRYLVSNNVFYNNDIAAAGFSCALLLNTHSYGVFSGNSFNPRSNTQCIGGGDGNDANRTLMSVFDNSIATNQSSTPYNGFDLATANYGDATISGGSSSVVVNNNLVRQNTAGEGSTILVNQVSGTPEAFTVATADGQFTITRPGTSGAAVYRYSIRQ